MLPIETAIPPLRQALRASSGAVLQAPPGAGKTTRVPVALLDEPWLAGRKIVMLEPRRIAARAAARYMSASRGEQVGGTIGFRVRFETRVGPRTRIEVVTEGVLTRMLQSDAALESVGLVIFDEFHERNLHADLGLALALQSQTLLRPDLRLLVMSATLDGAAVAHLLGDAPVITSEGRAFPVETRYLDRPSERVEGAVARAVRDALSQDEGGILAFLPGAAEIRRTAGLLGRETLPNAVDVTPLYGALPPDAQDRAIAPSAPGRRKVVLATSIAETSLTIEGVRVVIDCGLSRVPRFSPRTGMTRLETVRVSKASADQRRGRAGRVAPGVCYRLWPAHEEHHLVSQSVPEILEADLAPLALELAAAGIGDPGALRWLNAPPVAAFSQARTLLFQLGALDASGRITPHGIAMATLPTHPRLAHLVLRGAALGHASLACDVAALLGDRDILRGERAGAEVDLTLRVDALHDEGAGAAARGMSVDRDAVRGLRAESQDLQRLVRRFVRPPGETTPTVGALVALAYPERIGQRRPGQTGRYSLSGGGGAVLAESQLLTTAPYIAIADLDGQRQDSRIYLAAPIELAEIQEYFADDIAQEDIVEWSAEDGAVVARRRTTLGALVLADAPLREPDPERMAAVFAEGVLARGVGGLAWPDAARTLRARMAFLHAHDSGWPDVSDEALMVRLRDWLPARVAGMRRIAELRTLDLTGMLLGVLDWKQRSALDELAPTHITVPSGSRVAVDYSDPELPVLAVRLQEMFGLVDTPRLAGGRVPVVLHLLSPARRPVQVTRDLAGFWRTTYFEVRKDLRGRYPKHHWPDDPLSAPPTRAVKRRS
jgi:ATP-dependent helicase HrpB